MATYFVISDIHSFYNEMINALNKAGYDKENKNHVLISLGDLFDRGPDSIKCLNFINSIPTDRKICIKGNHEDLLEEVLDRGYFKEHDYHNHTNDTIHQLTAIENEEKAIDRCKELVSLKCYLDSCIDYFETDKYVFVHGWIPFNDNWRKGIWSTARWHCCFDAWNYGIIVPNKTIVAGHWHTSYGHSKYHHYGNEFEEEWIRIWNKLYPNNQIKNTACFDIFRDEGIIAVDGCVAYSKQVNVLKISKQKKLDFWR